MKPTHCRTLGSVSVGEPLHDRPYRRAGPSHRQHEQNDAQNPNALRPLFGLLLMRPLLGLVMALEFGKAQPLMLCRLIGAVLRLRFGALCPHTHRQCLPRLIGGERADDGETSC
jgi:hypothetical protein